MNSLHQIHRANEASSARQQARAAVEAGMHAALLKVGAHVYDWRAAHSAEKLVTVTAAWANESPDRSVEILPQPTTVIA